MRWVNQRPRILTEDTLRVANGGNGTADRGGAHHVHSMSQENPFLPTDDEIDDLSADEVSSVSNDSLERFRNWVPPTPEQEKQYWAPFVPPKEIAIHIKTQETKQDGVETTPEWLKLPLRNPSAHGPPPAAFAHIRRPQMTDSPQTAPHPTIQPCDHLRNMSWATETTVSMSVNQVSSHGSPMMVDRPRRRHQRGSSHQFCFGDLVGQSSFTGGGGSLVSAPTSTSCSLSGESFPHARRANRKLDELVADPMMRANRRLKNPLKEEVLHVFDKVSQPVKRLVKTHHHRSRSYDLYASEHGCLA